MLLDTYSKRLKTQTIEGVHQSALSYLIAVEDRRYMSHCGVDVLGIFRAIVRIIFFGRIEGASTIEQQLVRVLTNKYERTISRKMLEIILAMLMSREKSKDEMARFYLSIAYYGWEMSGYNEACRRVCLNLHEPLPHELASIVARLRYPEAKVASRRRLSQINNRANYAMQLSLNKSYFGLKGRVNGTI
ncbi:MAG: transglycosylase domain-containing protein [Methylobacter sp.]|nr:transglycosylase domain-containing protein [Methylobacter sp.]